MMKPIAAERQQQILDVLKHQHSVKIIELAEMFQVSKETIRRDLNALEEKGCLQKSYGGAIAAPKYEFDTVSLESRMHKDQDVKMKLCQKALEFLPEKAVIFVDTGSTMHCLAELLSTRTGYTILTNSLDAANVLITSKNRTVLTGGQLNPETMATDGFQTVEFLNKVKVDIAFLGTNGFEQHQGPSGTDFLDIQTKQAIIKNSKETIVISDSRKATYSALIQYATWRDIDHFITDSSLPERFQTSLAELTDVVLVDV
ncbi:DeoR/GlpR family DNA-binding transcription regulator [uncultured Mitsuokella sp.]|uniref:DeoR/GlpR family DNA-binding transcription regulator n=1 Tax=uncultured Mitsuokella sp. TaxID=453120 RepID=UPI002626C939|nr:DeoR/GlpR family DNA-binding transcription regulator [uncultured Mitsuokella sp.]